MTMISPLSIAVQKGHFDIVKYIIENSTDFDQSDTGKSPLFLAAEEGYHDILVVLLHSKYNDITKTYLGTTPLEIAVWIFHLYKILIFLNPQESQTNGNFLDISGVYFLPGSTVVQLSFYFSILLSPKELCQDRLFVTDTNGFEKIRILYK
jgi:hypothetical protein